MVRLPAWWVKILITLVRPPPRFKVDRSMTWPTSTVRTTDCRPSYVVIAGHLLQVTCLPRAATLPSARRHHDETVDVGTVPEVARVAVEPGRRDDHQCGGFRYTSSAFIES